MANGAHTFTKTGRLRKPELNEICEWIVSAWGEIDSAIIVKVFKKCGISNAMDGTEDDVLYEEYIKKTSQPDDSDDDDEEEETYDDSYYTDKDNGLTQQQLDSFFNTDDEDSDFEGFTEDDVHYHERE